MDPNRFAFLQYVDQTVIHPLGLTSLIVLSLAMLALPRRYAPLPLLIMMCFMAPAQRVIILSMNWTLLRLLLLLAMVRVTLYGEMRGLVLRPLDIVLALWCGAGTVAYVALFGSLAALQFRLGNTFDALAAYFFFRCMLRSWEDVERVVGMLAAISIPVACGFVAEHFSGRNVYAFLGGVPELTMAREGKLRCQGPYCHPILGGCFWATLTPMVASRWWAAQYRRWYTVVAVGCMVVIVLCTNSSTPLMALLFVLLGFAVFPLREHMRLLRWAVVAGLLALHLTMKAPVWALVAKVNVISGSTGWHRYQLVDQAIGRFGEWWLVGTKSTVHWDEYGMLEDVTSQYVLEAVRGGLVTLVLFVAILVVAYRQIGRAWRLVSASSGRMMLAWAMGVGLFAHTMIFISVSYDSVILTSLYLLLAMVTCAAGSQRAPAPCHQVASGPAGRRWVQPEGSRWRRQIPLRFREL